MFICLACSSTYETAPDKCAKCWSTKIVPVPTDAGPQLPPDPSPPPVSAPFPPEVLEMFERFMAETQRHNARREERCAELDKAEEARRDNVAKAAIEALGAVSELARAATAFLKRPAS